MSPVEITKTLLAEEFTEEEVTEVLADLDKTEADPEAEAEQEEEQAPTPVQPAPGKKSNYKQYDLWLIDISKREVTDHRTRDKYVVIESYTTIKKLREKVKLEQQVVDQLNAQSHNSLRRYYLSGSVRNGDTEKVNLETAAN